MDNQKEIKKITEQIIKGYNPEKIILFGSCANGKQNSASDIDLAVIKKTKVGFIVNIILCAFASAIFNSFIFRFK